MHKKKLSSCVRILINGFWTSILLYRDAHEILKRYQDAPGTFIAMMPGTLVVTICQVSALYTWLRFILLLQFEDVELSLGSCATAVWEVIRTFCLQNGS